MYVKWDMSDGRFWEPIGDNCVDLFLMFDTDAHVSDGVPDVPVDKVLAHVRECQECTDACVTVTGAGTTLRPAVLHYDW